MRVRGQSTHNLLKANCGRDDQLCGLHHNNLSTKSNGVKICYESSENEHTHCTIHELYSTQTRRVSIILWIIHSQQKLTCEENSLCGRISSNSSLTEVWWKSQQCKPLVRNQASSTGTSQALHHCPDQSGCTQTCPAWWCQGDIDTD